MKKEITIDLKKISTKEELQILLKQKLYFLIIMEKTGMLFGIL